jgi:hypothetical protein
MMKLKGCSMKGMKSLSMYYPALVWKCGVKPIIVADITCMALLEVPKMWGAPPRRGVVGPLGARVICMRDIFILNEI